MLRMLCFLCLSGFCLPSSGQRGLEYAKTQLPEVLDSIERIMENQHIPGLLLTLATRDSILYDGGLGLARVEEEQAVNRHSQFRLGSISKSFAVLCLLQLEAEGKLSLENPLSEVAPEVLFDNPWEETDPVRIVHLLEHTAGFDDMHFHAIYNEADAEPGLLEMVQRHEKSLVSRWRPGTRYSYSNPGYVIATYLIEKFSGEPYHDFVRKTVFEPLGMPDADFESFPGDDPQYAQGYRYESRGYEPIPFYPILGGMAGALNASGADMGPFLQFLLNDGKVDTVQVFPAELLRKMERTTTTLAATNGLTGLYALANAPASMDRPFQFRGHDGGIDGFSSSYGYARRLGLAYALSINRNTNLSPIRNLLLDYLSQSMSTMQPSKKKIPADTVSAYTGYYEYRSPRNETFFFMERLQRDARIYFKGDTLFRKQLSAKPQKLVHIGEGQFRAPGDYQPTYVLARDQEGKLVLAGWDYYETAPAWKVLGRRWGVIAAFFLLPVFWLIGLIALVIGLVRKDRRLNLALLLFWIAATGLFIMALPIFDDVDPMVLGKRNLSTMSIYLGGLILGLGTIAGWLFFIFRKTTSPQPAWHSVGLAGFGLVLLILALYFWEHDWLGLMFWRA